MAIAPSSNLLNALSQLQGSRSSSAASAAPAAGSSSFAAQLNRVAAPSQTGSVGQAGSSSAVQQPLSQAPASETQSRPRNRYLGQYVNILV